MSKILRLHSGGNEQYRGWQESIQLTETVIDQNIVDPAGGNARRTATAIPTPFGQLHLLETAFKFAADNPLGQSMYHRLVSQCWDLLEFLFYAKDTDAYRLRFVPWKRAEQLQQLQANPRTALLGRTLDLYLANDRHFEGVESLFLIFAEHKSGQERRLLGGTSPFTLVFAHPALQPLPVARKNGQGQYFDQLAVPLSARPEPFQTYIYGLFTVERALRDKFFAYGVYRYLQALNPNRVNQLDGQGLTAEAFAAPYESWLDDYGNVVQVRGVGLRRLSQARQAVSSDWFIVPNPALLAAHPRLPLVLRPGLDLRRTNYFAGTPGDDTAVVGYAAPAGYEKLETRELPGLGELYPYLTVNDFLEDVLVEVPFAVNRDKYHFGEVQAEPGQTLDQRPFRYLLPLKRAYFDYFKPEDLARQLRLTVFSNHVQARLTIPVSGGRTVEYERRYALPGPGQPAEQAVPSAPSQSADKPYGGGRVAARLQIAVFPFYKFVEPTMQGYNNAYSVMLAEQGETAAAPAQLRFLTYSATGGPQELGAAAGGALRGVVARTRQVRSPLSPASTYYEVRGTHFDLLEVSVSGGSGYGSPPATGLLAPNWRTDVGGTTKFTFAVDFGTTNTHVAVAANGNVAEPFTMGAERELQTVLLSQPEAAGDYDLPSRYQVRAFPRASLLQNREFVPSFVGIRGAEASFPIRTATCETPRFAAEGEPLLFGDANVGFFLSRDSELYSQPEDGRYETNLKWNTDGGPNADAGKKRVRLYFRELLRLLKHKAALNGGDLNQVRLVWSYPLSMDVATQYFFSEVWSDEYNKAFGRIPNESQLDKVPESLAPYLYLRKIGKIVPTQEDSVVNIDIGGGTTDVLLLDGLQPAATFSFRFAGDVLWGDLGTTAADGNRAHNGLLLDYRSRTKNASISDEAKKANEVFLAALRNNSVGSADLVSLLFNFDEQLQFSQYVREAKQMRVLLLLHYAAILYHVGQVCRAKGLKQLPRHVTFSGKGSTYLRLLDLNANLSTIKRLAQRVLEFASGLQVPADFSLTLVDNAKEATANGSALRWDESGGQELERTMRQASRDSGAELGEMLEKLQFVLPGNEQFAPADETAAPAPDAVALIRRPTLLSEAGDLREGVLANARHLLDFLTQDREDGVQDLLARLNIELDADFVRDFLTSRFKDSLNTGYNALVAASKKPGDKLPESLFFFAFRDALFKLSQELYRKYYAAQTV
ncbi:hypothetical protein [Hymenobacter siberiensis]|uniref:hypothetical protein n=1 Tax=Hymenobacter siberiensis TaxID=2848396 RepID=UPI001C1E2605|nr:hypothetical protein [Hymenobacter siberiensis]